jgi:ABC-type phosphate/phosphonate transport system substrate-binding protein
MTRLSETAAELATNSFVQRWRTRLSVMTAILAAPILLFCSAMMQAAEDDGKVETGAATFQLIVMDPLAAPLSCPCVEGYAQRKYEVLSEYLSREIGRPVNLIFAESLEAGLEKSGGHADLIIGKDSVVRFDASKSSLKVKPVARLTDKSGSTMQHGLIVVNRDDPAQKTADLKGYSVIFGPEESDEKHAAAMELLKTAGVAIPAKLTIDEACSDGACKVIELGTKGRSAAVISSYAQPLLEGCGTIKKGDLRVVGQTKDVPFITAFVTDQTSNSDVQKVSSALIATPFQPEVIESLETLLGFVPITDAESSGSADKVTAAAAKKK